MTWAFYGRYRRLKHSKIVWKDDLATGLSLIDRQHKEFFRLVNKLLDSSVSIGFSADAKAKTPVFLNKEDKPKIIIDSFVFLKYYILEHFAVEESAMMEYKYPYYPVHKARHIYFRNEIDRLELSLKANVPPHEVAIKLNYLIVNWFTNHIKTEDKKLCKYLLTEVEDGKKQLLGRLKTIVKGFFKK